jgi:hypothetical protein
MSEPELTLEAASKELVRWTKALLYEVENSLPEVEHHMGKSNGKSFPSRQQQALLVFRGVKEKLTEVQGFVKLVEKAIRDSK